jgi:hypothetical protein
MKRSDDELIEDVSAASAAYVFNVAREILKRDAPDAFRRWYDLFYGAITAYRDARGGWLGDAKPSDN